jgi:hypothetical protein
MSKPKKTVKKTRRKKQKRLYFTQVHEDAIIEYAKTDDIKRRTELYVNLIGPALNEMVDKIVFTYKFTTLSNIGDLRDECKIWLTTILDKYDKSKGYKAFSYFSVITKNWFIHKVKVQQKKRFTEVDLDNMSRDSELEYMSTQNKWIEDTSKAQFWACLAEEMASWNPEGMKDNEKKVYEAVKILLAHPDDIEIFNKKAIYLYLREITGLNTKQVVNNLNKMRVKYRTFKVKWEDGKI